jgi:hypothetical protein
MVTDTETLIKNLQKSQLSAECPQCNEEFSLSKTLLFDGRKKFPTKAEAVKLEWQKELDKKIAELQKRQVMADEEAEKDWENIKSGKRSVGL